MSKSYLAEAFEELELVDDDKLTGTFDFDKKGAEDLKKFMEDDTFNDFETVIDPEAETEEDLQDSYIGMGILGCDICHSMIYKPVEEIVIDEETQMANVGECCPYCYERDGFKIIGKVAPFEDISVEVEKTEDGEEVPEPTVKVNGKDVPVEEAPAKEEEALTAEQKYPVQSPIHENVNCKVVKSKRKAGAIKESVVPMMEEDKPAATSIEDAQKWVDYDMKRYGKISERTNKLVKKAGFQIIKDDHGDYEVAAGKFESYEEKQVKDGHENIDDVKADIKDDHADELEEGCKVEEELSNSEKLFRAFPELREPIKESVTTSDVMSTEEFLDWHDNKVNPKKDFSKLKQIYNIFQLNGCSEDADVDVCYDACDDKQKREITDIILTESFKKSNLTEGMEDILPLDDFLHFYDSELLHKKDEDKIKLQLDRIFAREGCPEDVYADECYEMISDKAKAKISKIVKEYRKSNLTEGMEDISITTDDQVIKVKATPREDKETIVPVEPKEIEAAQPEAEEPADSGEEELMDIELDEIDETSFDELGESYLKKVYDNVNSFKTVNGSLDANNRLVLEGVIEFKSGKKAKTNFIFEAKEITRKGKIKFIGENVNLSKNKRAFTLTGSTENKNLICEQFNYNYLAKDEKSGASKRLYGTIRK